MQEFDEIWDAVLEELSKTASRTAMNLWFRDSKLVELTDSSAIISVKTEFMRNTLEKNYTEQVSDVLFMLLGEKAAPKFVLADSYTPSQAAKAPVKAEQSVTEVIQERAAAIEAPPQAEPGFFDTENLSFAANATEYTFDNFIVGSSNKFAHAACRSVAKTPAPAVNTGTGQSYNPLFIYGPSGLGKTHLLYAIINEIRKNYPTFKITYVKGDEFTNQMVESLGKGLNVEFREKFRKTDVLLIDDIHFIAGKEGTQEEFFNTFNDLYEHKKQIILTSDRPPKDIQKLEERLRTRFEWGLLADIQPPDFELRVAIMAKKAEKLGKQIPMDVLQFLAEKLTNNVRQMEGAIKRIIAYSMLNEADITIAMVNTCISDLLSDTGVIKITPEKIVSKIADKYSVSESEIYGKARTASIAKSRHIAVYLMRKVLDLSYPSIGKIFKRDHTTIMNSYSWIENEIKENASFEIEINDLIKEFQS